MSKDKVDSTKESRIGFVAKILDALSGLIGIIIFANILGVEGLGAYYVLLAIVYISTAPMSGVSLATEHYIGKSEGNKSDQFAIAGILLSFIFSLSVSALLLILYTFIPSDLSEFRVDNMNMIALFIAIICLTFYTITKSIYSGIGNPGKSVFMSTGQGISETIIQIVLLVGLSLGIFGLLIGTAIGYLIASLYVWVAYKPAEYKRPDYGDIKSIIRYSGSSSIYRTTRSFYKRLDTIILAIILTPSAVGIYEAAIRIAKGSKYTAYAINKTIIINTSQKLDNTKEIVNDLNNLGGYASILTIPLFFGSIVIGQELLQLVYLDPEFSQGYIILIFSGIYFSLYGHKYVLSAFFNGLGHPSIPMKGVLISTFILVVTGTIGTHYIGVNGIIIGIISAELSGYVYYNYAIYNELKQGYKPNGVIHQIIAGLVMFIVIYPTKMFVLPDILWIQVIITISLGCLIYLITISLLDDKIKNFVKNRYRNINRLT